MYAGQEPAYKVFIDFAPGVGVTAPSRVGVTHPGCSRPAAVTVPPQSRSSVVPTFETIDRDHASARSSGRTLGCT